MLNVNILIGDLGGGGAERVVSELIQSPPINTEVTVCTFTTAKHMYVVEDAQNYVLDTMPLNTCFKRFLFHISPRVLYRMYLYNEILHRCKCDVSVSFMEIPNLINLIVSHHYRRPIVVSIRNNVHIKTTILDNLSTALVLFLIKIYSPYLITNSEENKDYLIKRCNLSPDKAICIYNPKDINKIQSLQAEPIEDNFFKTHDLILLNVGRLTSQKGQVHLLRIFRKLRQVSHCRLVISGHGELESQLKSLSHDLGVEQYVLFTGWCDNPYKYMNHADIFIFTSLSEGQPNAMIEALICGCPIVSADCDYGPREILDGGKYGVLTKKFNGKIKDLIHAPLTDAEQDMYDKTLYLIDHPDVRKAYAELSKERIGIFAKEKIINEYFSVFKTAAEDA